MIMKFNKEFINNLKRLFNHSVLYWVENKRLQDDKRWNNQCGSQVLLFRKQLLILSVLVIVSIYKSLFHNISV